MEQSERKRRRTRKGANKSLIVACDIFCWCFCVLWHPGFRLSNVERHTFNGKHLWFFILKDMFRHRKELLFVGLNDHYMLLCITNGSSCFSNYPMYLVKFGKRKIVSAWYGITFDENVRSKEDVLKYMKQGSYLPILN